MFYIGLNGDVDLSGLGDHRFSAGTIFANINRHLENCRKLIDQMIS